MRKKALVTGGAGFIGSHLSEELLDKGFSVTAVDNLSTGSRSNIAHLIRGNNFKFYKDTILNEKLMSRLIKKSDIVYHMAAAVGVEYILDHPVDSILTNIEGSYIVLKLASRYHKKIILASTSEVYGKHVCMPIKEKDDRTLGSTSVSRWGYSDAKAMDEFLAFAYAKERKLPVVIVRLFNTVGPRQTGRYGMVLPKFINEALSGKPITVYGDGSQVRTFTYVKDAVRAIVELSLEKKAAGQAFNIGSGQSITIKELAEEVRRRTRSKSPIKYISYEKAFNRRSADFEDIQCRIPDISRLEKAIGYSSRYDIGQMIDNTVKYFIDKKRKG